MVCPGNICMNTLHKEDSDDDDDDDDDNNNNNNNTNIFQYNICNTPPRKCTKSIFITPHWIFLHASIHKGRSSRNQTKAIPHKTKLATFVHIWHGVNSQLVKM